MIKFENVTKIYQPNEVILDNVSFDVKEGEFVSIVGKSGAGKTTLIGILTGLVTKTSGEAAVFGHDTVADSSRAKTFIGLVPQEFNFNIFEKVEDIVVTQAGYYGIPRAQALARAKTVLTDLGLWDKRRETAQKLSGGMKRRLMIARALIHEPKFLILDEPTAGVDVELRRSMWDYLRKLTGSGVTILLTTHYLEEAEQLASHVAIINKGEIAASGTMEEILALHDEEEAGKRGYRGGKLEEVFLQLTKEK